MTRCCAGGAPCAHSPYANTIETKARDAGIIHAGPVHRNCTRTVANLGERRHEAIETALVGGSKGDGAEWREKPGTDVRGVRALITGHHPSEEVQRGDNWWCIDTGAGVARLVRLTLASVDREPIEVATVDAAPKEQGTGL